MTFGVWWTIGAIVLYVLCVWACLKGPLWLADLGMGFGILVSVVGAMPLLIWATTEVKIINFDGWSGFGMMALLSLPFAILGIVPLHLQHKRMAQRDKDIQDARAEDAEQVLRKLGA